MNMYNMFIGKCEILKLKKREQEVLKELNNDGSFMKSKSGTIFDFKTLRLQRELKLLQTKLKLLSSDENDIA